MKAKIIEPNGNETLVAPADGKRFTVEEIQKIVGGYFITVIVRDKQQLRSMAMNEEGMELRLLPNHKATELFKTCGGQHSIVGTVLVCHRNQIR